MSGVQVPPPLPTKSKQLPKSAIALGWPKVRSAQREDATPLPVHFLQIGRVMMAPLLKVWSPANPARFNSTSFGFNAPSSFRRPIANALLHDLTVRVLFGWIN